MAGVTKEVVRDFWLAQDFDLTLPNVNGETPWGNCDLCFLKNASKVASLIAEEPQRAIWWARMETIATPSKPSGFYFRTDRPSYAQMMKFTADQRSLFDANEEAIACFCGD